VIGAELDHRARQLETALELWQERARAAFDVEHEAREPFREFLAHDAGSDEWDGLHRRRCISECVHLSIGRRDLARLTDEHAAESLELRARDSERQVSAESRNRLELVERTARVGEAAPRHHRHRDANRRDERRENDRHLVADAAGGVLVDARNGEVRQVERVSALQHGVGQRRRLGAIEAAEVARHQKRGHLIVGDVTRGVGARQGVPLAGFDPTAVALSFDEPRREHH
jgi:hypothetical protein